MKTHMRMLLFALVGIFLVGCQASEYDVHKTENGFNIDGEAYVKASKIDDGFMTALKEGGDMVVYDGKTWIPEEGNPVQLIVLNDEKCGAPCDATKGTAFFTSKITRAMMVETVDVASEFGEKLVEDFEVLGVPAFILGDGIEDLERYGAKVIDQLKPIVTEVDGRYLVDGNSIGVKPGKFLRPIEFADLKTEPSKGKGKVKVVEFTDYQCPYCKRLHDQNKDLIEKLIADGTITYVVKDFPLSFHKEAGAMHSAANCAMEVGGKDKYWVVNEYLFQNPGEIKGLGDQGARDLYSAKAEDWGLNADKFEKCMNSEATKAEITADIQEGSKNGVSGTPALFIGNSFVPGAIGPDALQQYVDSAKAQ